jgi:hypothetical protein
MLIRIAEGRFRALHRLLTQIGRVMEINRMDRVTSPVVEAARESLVVGRARLFTFWPSCRESPSSPGDSRPAPRSVPAKLQASRCASL